MPRKWKRFHVYRINWELLDQCLNMFIQNPASWDARGYIRQTSAGLTYDLPGLAVALSGMARKTTTYWYSAGPNGDFHNDGKMLLGITDDVLARDLFSANHLRKPPEEYKAYVYGRLGRAVKTVK